MNVKIYAIGGNLNGKYLGTATDVETGLSLIDLIELTKGYACSVHGFCGFIGTYGLDKCTVSGEISIKQARNMFTTAAQDKVA